MQKEEYVSPEISVVECCVEKGFASSGDGVMSVSDEVYSDDTKKTWWFGD